MYEDINNTMNDIRNVIDGVTVDDIQLDGVQMRVGNKIVKLEVVSSDPIDIEGDIREEYKQKVTDKLKGIKSVINNKFNDIIRSVDIMKENLKSKEIDLQRKLSSTNLMPEVYMSHAEEGLSVVNGINGITIWLVQGVYAPKFVDNRFIEKSYQKRMMSHVTFMIETEGNKILRISTRKPLGLMYFNHYHQSRPDCWGDWKPQRTFEDAEDIIQLAREAESVLEKINSHSLADRNPNKLPRFDTLMKHLTNERQEDSVNQRNERTGMNSFVDNTDDVWVA